MDLWVIVPAYDEERSIAGTLRALAAQTDRDFTTLVVDNGSTDGTARVVSDFAGRHPELDLRLVTEPQKGTGAAADTGMRFAITAGAGLLARTDADCLPDPDWIAAVRRAFGDGLELIGGPLRPRTDEFRLRAWERWLLPAVLNLAALAGRYRPVNRSADFHGPYVMVPGCNMAITADLYLRAGGFPRGRIEDVHEDHVLLTRVRRLTAAYGVRKDVRVRGSVRRLRAYGLIRTLGWYADHRYRPETVDIR